MLCVKGKNATAPPGVMKFQQANTLIIMSKAFRETLARFVPVEALDEVVELIDIYQIQLKIRKSRLSKLGDFRPGVNGRLPQISLNGSLNVYAFLLVFLHELAHHIVWEKYGPKAAAHGKAWKETFGFLLRDFAQKGFFHPSITEAVIDYSFKVKATGLASASLQRQLRMFDKEPAYDSEKVFLEDMPEQSLFVAANGRLFRKEGKLRKRYRCLCMRNKRTYLFQPMAEVFPAKEEKNN